MFDFSDEQLFGSKKEGVDFRWYLTPWEHSKNRYWICTKWYLQLFSTIKERLKDEVIWVKLFRLWYEKNADKDVAITDVRFPHEIEAIKSLGGKIVKIKRNCLVNTHISENYIDSIKDEDIFYEQDNNYKRRFIFSNWYCN